MLGSGISFAGLLDFDASIDDWMGVIKELFAALAGFLKYFGIDLFAEDDDDETEGSTAAPVVE